MKGERDEDRGEGEWKLMEKRHEDYYRLISSETDGDDDDRKLEGGKREGEMEGGELEEERRNVSPAADAASSLPLSLDLTPSIPAATEG